MDFKFKQGSVPLLVSMPHIGTDIPDDIAGRLTSDAKLRQDTDWHLDQLYGFAGEIGASTIGARWSRYVIDLNRPPENTNLYPGMSTTGLCPVDTFHDEPLYVPGQQPTEAEGQQRLERYWRPYHEQLKAELERLLSIHGKVVLWDAHSIASVVPRFFEGKLPDLNFGSADGTSCDQGMLDAVVAAARTHEQYTVAVNGRFKGGHITRYYGQPQRGIHAIQLEMCQCLYMEEEPPFGYLPERADEVQGLLRELTGAALDWIRR